MIQGVLLAVVTLTLPSWGNGAPDLRIDVPAGYRLNHTEGADFDVFYFARQRGGASLGLYVGHHPSTEDCAQPAADLARISWRRSETRAAKRTAYGADALLEGLFAGSERPGVSALLVHVFVRGADAAEVGRLKDAVASLRVSPESPRRRARFRSFTLPSHGHRRCDGAAVKLTAVAASQFVAEACDWLKCAAPDYETTCRPTNGKSLVGDFDGDGQPELATLVTMRACPTTMLLIVSRPAGWHMQSCGEWAESVAPVKLDRRPKGHYERAPPYDRERVEGEVDEIDTPGDGVLATFSDGRRRLFSFADSRCKHVYRGFEGNE
jgi:hypothetical protein